MCRWLGGVSFPARRPSFEPTISVNRLKYRYVIGLPGGRAPGSVAF